jgi:hypothetical protein
VEGSSKHNTTRKGSKGVIKIPPKYTHKKAIHYGKNKADKILSTRKRRRQ